MCIRDRPKEAHLGQLVLPEQLRSLLRPAPVSYTHLDVYKRQVGAIAAPRKDRCIQPGDPWCCSKGQLLIAPAQPDVYQRQACTSAR